MRASLKLNVIENMDCVRICGAFIVLYLQYSVKGAVKKYVKLCDTLKLRPALAIFQSGVLSNVSTGYINLVSQSDEESHCTVTPNHTKLKTIAYVSFVESSETQSMSICAYENDTTECVTVHEKKHSILSMMSTTTLQYRADKQYTGEAACLKILVVGATANITCYDRKKTTSSATQVSPTTGASLSSTVTMNETIPFSTEPFQTKPIYTQARSDKGEINSSSGTAAGFVTVPVISTVAGVLVCLLIVAVVLLIKNRKKNADALTKRNVGRQRKNASDEVQDQPADDAEYTYIDGCPSINTESSNKTTHETKKAKSKMQENVGAHVLKEYNLKYSYAECGDCMIKDCEQSKQIKKTLVAVHVPCHSGAIVCTKHAIAYESLTGDRSTDGEYASKLEIHEARKQTSKKTLDAMHVPCHSDPIVCTEHASAYESLTGDRSTDGEYTCKLEIPEASYSYQWVTVDEDAQPCEDEIASGGTADVTAGDMYLTVVDND